MYEGILPQKNKVESFMNREENVKLWVMQPKKDGEKIVNEAESVKLQFQKAEDAKAFRQLLKGPEKVEKVEDKQEK